MSFPFPPPTVNTEEAFVLSSLKEFVRLWGSGCQALFHLECKDSKASLQFSTKLGYPADRHFVPHVPLQEHHGYQGAEQQPHHLPRKKGPAQKERDRARAAAHRARQSTAVAADSSEQSRPLPVPSPPPSRAASAVKPPDPQPNSPDASAGHVTSTPPTDTAAVPVDPPADARPLPPPNGPPPSRVPVVSFEEVKDEVHHEQSEVIVYATGIFENCPDQRLFDEYFESLQKFILSENHLQSNISNVKIVPTSSRQTSHLLYTHAVSVEITVKTEKLWEPPRAYIVKHFGKSDWLRGNKTRIYLTKIQ